MPKAHAILAAELIPHCNNPPHIALQQLASSDLGTRGFYMATSVASHPLPFERTLAQPKAERGLLGRFFDALVEARQREAERRVAQYLSRENATHLTDDMERKITTLL
jgi:hypothetical protein